MLNFFKRRLTTDGKEIPDPTPMAPPVGFTRQPTLRDQIREMIASERLRAEAEAAGYESFDESDDFDIPDEPGLPVTPYDVEVAPPDYEFEPNPPAPEPQPEQNNDPQPVPPAID